MHMIWHNDKTNAPRVERLQLMIEDAQEDLFWVIEIQQATTTFH